MIHDELMDQDWDIVKSMLPSDWEESARSCGALRRCRNVKTPEMLLRLILLHVAGGISLRQTVARAKAMDWVDISDVAMLKRLRASANWLEYLCSAMWTRPQWPACAPFQKWRWRVVDATTIQEPAAVGISWRIHYVVGLPHLGCDHIQVTTVKGGESFCRIPVRAGDVILADRGYSHRAGVAWVLSQGGHVIVRHQGANFPLTDRQGQTFDLLAHLRQLAGHQCGSWEVSFGLEGQVWPVWLHAVRKSKEAAEHAKEELLKERRDGIQPQTLELAEYVVVLTSLPPQEISAIQTLGMYRGRWQIELIFKVLKSLLGIGELAKYDPDSARAWLQAKLLTALIIERLRREARLFSPYGFSLDGPVQLEGDSRNPRQSAASDCARIASAPTAG
jgi:hypothetical protein